MNPVQFSDGVLNLYEKDNVNIYDYVKQNFLSFIFQWCINTNLRRSVALSSWLSESLQVEPKDLIDICDKTTSDKDFDKQAWLVMNWVQDFLKYKADSAHWGANDYWALPEEVILGTEQDSTPSIDYGPMEGDCEDGAILCESISANSL